MRRRRSAVAVVLLALCAWWWLPEEREVLPVVRAPEPYGEEACAPAAGPLWSAPPEQVTDTARPPPPPPLPRLRCPMPEDVIALAPSGTVRLDRRGDAAFEVATFDGDALVLPHYADIVGGTVYLDGFSPAQLSVVGGRCVVGPLVAQASVSGVIVPTAGAAEGQVAVQGCGANVQVDRFGTFFAQIDPGPCTMFAVRRDGALNVRSIPVHLDPTPGQELLVELVLPTWQAASVGLEIRQDADGAVVVGPIQADGPAAHADLLAGDAILAVDGAEVEGLSLWEIMDLALGPEGSEVVYTVERDGRRIDVALTRETQD